MIILPDRTRPIGRVLMPMYRRQWITPSRAQSKDQFGNENYQTFRLRALADDGHVLGRWFFRDREDADAFLETLIRHEVLGESVPRALWSLPEPLHCPDWHPDLWPVVQYDFATLIFLSTVGSGTITSPSDWNNGNNLIEGLGGGGSGAAASGSRNADGGGGGEYRATANFVFASPGTSTAPYTVGDGGAANTANNLAGNTGAQTNFNTNSLIAMPGTGGFMAVGGAPAGGTGGTGAAGNADGGAGGQRSSANAQATGAGGAGGPSGAGNSAPTGANSTGSAGGAGDAGSGSGGTAGPGVTGATSGGAGGNGTEWDASHGCGGGGGGVFSSSSFVTVTGGAAGLYGAGSGGGQGSGSNAQGRSRIGGQGLLVLTYTPQVYAGFMRRRPIIQYRYN